MADIKSVLENWARWARDRYHKQHCASIEHRYARKTRPDETLTGWGDWETSSPEAIAPPLDILQAVEVQKVIGRLGFQYAWALTFGYCYPRYDRWKAAAFCGVYRPERLARLIRKAEHMVANNLQTQSGGRYKTGVVNQRTGANPDSPSRERPATRPGLVFRKAA